MMGYDALWPGGPRFTRRTGAFKVGTDSVLLAHFTDVKRAKLACDLGCGGGVLPVVLCLRNPDMTFHGVELSGEAVSVAQENAAANGLEARFQVFHQDLRIAALTAGAYDLVVSNPPYFRQGSGRPAADPRMAAARDDRDATLADICRAGAKLLCWGGLMTMVQRPERLSEVFCAMSASGIEPKRLRLVIPRPGAPPNLILAEGRRGGGPGLTIESPLVLLGEDGGESDEIYKIYHRGEER